MNHEQIDSGPAYAAGTSFDELRLTQGEIYEREQAAMRINFASACQKADANALCEWAPRRNDFSPYSTKPRMQTLAEVMSDALDFTIGPDMREVMQLVLNVANGGNLALAQMQAQELLTRMSEMYAKYNTGSEE